MSSTFRRASRSFIPPLVLFVTAVAGAQQPPAARFQVAGVGDSTFTFLLGKMRWVKEGQNGLAVDPRRNDGLVARFRVLKVVEGEATALVTGKTMELSRDHVALIEPRLVPWYRQRFFWVGVLVGGSAGAFAASR
ncbi:MAG: hypothetical protein H7Z74_16140 [Anaerolineae bacterium]|nr:hypothetical protein [Gemmatimonadaceae bacterium]